MENEVFRVKLQQQTTTTTTTRKTKKKFSYKSSGESCRRCTARWCAPSNQRLQRVPRDIFHSMPKVEWILLFHEGKNREKRTEKLHFHWRNGNKIGEGAFSYYQTAAVASRGKVQRERERCARNSEWILGSRIQGCTWLHTLDGEFVKSRQLCQGRRECVQL